ncbi:MAG: Ppx/GppA family phosphatase, partial [Epsilonproteobacteria bacterium]
LIAILTKFTKKSLPNKKDIEQFKKLLPDIEIIQWLSFMMTLNISLNAEFNKTKYEYSLDDNILNIISNDNQYLVQRALYKIKAPVEIELNLIKD